MSESTISLIIMFGIIYGIVEIFLWGFLLSEIMRDYKDKIMLPDLKTYIARENDIVFNIIVILLVVLPIKTFCYVVIYAPCAIVYGIFKGLRDMGKRE